MHSHWYAHPNPNVHPVTHSYTPPLNSQIVFEIGTDVAKDFDGELYRGGIVDVDEDVDNGGVLYSVKYEDGDREDLSAAECKIAVEYRQKIESGEINEWEIGEE